MLYAIGLQESEFKHRSQVGGPARSFWQFELSGGIRGVLNHKASQPHIRKALDALAYDYAPDTSFEAIKHNDVLACCYARCLLWTLPDTLPGRDEADEAWEQYEGAWRPGKPHRATWNPYFEQAWNLIDKGDSP